MKFLALTATLLVSAATVAASTTTSATSMGNATAPTAVTSTGTAVSSPTSGLKAGERCKAGGTFRCGGNETSSWIEVCNMDRRWYPAKEWMCGGPGCCFSQGSRLCCGCMRGAVDCPVAAEIQLTEWR